MKKTLLVLLTFICANTAFAQQNPYLHPNGSALSLAEMQTLMNLVMELMASSNKHIHAEMRSYQQDIKNHIDHDIDARAYVKNAG